MDLKNSVIVLLFSGQGTASEATLIGLLAARSRAIQIEKNAHPSVTSADVTNRLVCYFSDQVRSMFNHHLSMLGSVNACMFVI